MKTRNEYVFIIVAVIILVALIGVAAIYEVPPVSSNPSNDIKKFSSYDELKNFIKTNMESSSYSGGLYATMGEAVKSTAVAGSATPSAAPLAAERSSDYSTTNIQVSGVDEADIVKNDGKYIYMVSGRKILIMDAYPAENAKIISEIELNGTPQEIFINKDKLVVFGYESYNYAESSITIPGIAIMPRYYSSNTFVKVYDVTDRSNPVIKRDVSVEGNYFDSRMIGDYVYAVVNQPVYYSEPGPIPLPVITSNENVKMVSASDIYYFDYSDNSYTFTNIVSINTQDDNQDVASKTLLLGYNENMYVSPDNIYIVYTKRLNEYDF